MSQYLLITGGTIFSILGLLHALYTICDIYRPKHFAPVDPTVIDQMASTGVRLARGRTNMWDAWLGFNISHGLGGRSVRFSLCRCWCLCPYTGFPQGDTADSGVSGRHLFIAGASLLV